MPPSFDRRTALAALASGALLSACGSMTPATGPAPAHPPIVFVHGNGDTAALWITTLWRFESNGWPRERLHAVDIPYPAARSDDARPQAGRSSTAEAMQHLAAEVERVLAATGAPKVVLVGSSRGGYAIRNYIAHGGAARVSHAVLCGTPNHGVWANAGFQPGSEFNGAGAFLRGLNAPQGPEGNEVTPGVKWLTLRSDRNDKYAQPDGQWIGAPGQPTGVSFDGPALKGATNEVIANADHREVAFGPQAFAHAFRFITGREPATTAIAPEAAVVLDGKVSGVGVGNDPKTGSDPSNLPLDGATVEVHAVDPATGERRATVHRQTIDADGRWGPFNADPKAAYEFVVSAPGYATTHIYRSPFPRSSDLVNLRARTLSEADRKARAVVVLDRPRGYFGVPRDEISLDGRSPPAGIPAGVAGVSSATVRLADGVGRAVAGAFNGERIVGRAWPVAGDELTILELTY